MTRFIAILFATIASAPVFAEETIFDPENPEFADDADATESTGETSEDGGEETIFDPENPELDTDETMTEESPSAPAALDTVRFLGGWSTTARLDTAWENPEEDIVELSSDLRLRLEWDASQAMRVVVGGELRHWMAGKSDPQKTDFLVNASDPRADLDLRLGEAYILLREGSWSLAMGNLITRWGATDLTRPGDVVNPVDLTQLDGARAGTRLPQPTIDLTYSGNGWSWQGLLVPFFVGDDVWLIGRDSALLNPSNSLLAEQFPVGDLAGWVLDDSVIDDVQPILASSTVPDETPNNASLGTRFTATVANTDLGAGYFFGWDRQAYFEIDPAVRTLLVEVSSDPLLVEDLDALAFFVRNQAAREAITSITEKAQSGETLFSSKHRRLHTLTADMARYIGPIGIRADVAFQPAKTYFTETFTSVRRPTLSAALGLSWEHLESETDLFTVTVEGFITKPFAYDDGITKTFVDEIDRGVEGEELLIYDDLAAGVASAVVWMIPVVEARLQLAALTDLTQPDLILSAEASRELFSWLDLTLGAVLFEGPELDETFSIGGVYDTNDAVYIRLDGLL